MRRGVLLANGRIACEERQACLRRAAARTRSISAPAQAGCRPRRRTSVPVDRQRRRPLGQDRQQIRALWASAAAQAALTSFCASARGRCARPARSSRPRPAAGPWVAASTAAMRCGVDDHGARQRVAHGPEPPPCAADHVRQDRPFELPGGAVALVRVQRRLVHAADQRGVAARQRHQRLGPDRVRFLRHGRGAAALGLAHLADLVLRQQQHVLAELAQRARDQRQPGGELGQAVALAVPGHRRAAEPQLARPAPP